MENKKADTRYAVKCFLDIPERSELHNIIPTTCHHEPGGVVTLPVSSQNIALAGTRACAEYSTSSELKKS